MDGRRAPEFLRPEMKVIQDQVANQKGEYGHEPQRRQQCLQHMLAVRMKDEGKPGFRIVRDHKRDITGRN
jgi:hypothetical protein